LADGNSGLAVIDISDPTNPGTPGYTDTAGNARGVYVSGDFAYVADALSGLAIIDLLYTPPTPTDEEIPLEVIIIVSVIGGVVVIAVAVVILIRRKRK